VLDFASALYLGWRHASRDLPPWRALSEGRPAALAEPAGAREAAAELAELLGREAALLLPSTLHLFWDLAGVLIRDGATIYMDRTAYPLARWGAERGAALGHPPVPFAPSAAALAAALGRTLAPGRRPVVFTDGLQPVVRRQPPWRAYLALVRRHRGLLVQDDTQALGVCGAHGRGSALAGPGVLVAASLAKGFGVPVAVLAGESALIGRFAAASQTREHASPPSVAVIAALARALALNRARGDAARARLADAVRRFRVRLEQGGLACDGGAFPVQSPRLPPGTDVARLHAALEQRGVRTVLHRARDGHAPRLSFLLSAAHPPAAVERAAQLLLDVARRVSPDLQTPPGAAA
jgi:8-amino-7-oxononanoate synthase